MKFFDVPLLPYLGSDAPPQKKCKVLIVSVMLSSRSPKRFVDLFFRFVVQDKTLTAERLLTLVPLPPSCPIKPSKFSRDSLLSLFRCLQHPYIHPVLDVEFWDNSAALFSPLNPSGSLKDVIYSCAWQEDYDRKYTRKGGGLPLRQVSISSQKHQIVRLVSLGNKERKEIIVLPFLHCEAVEK